MSFQFIPFKRSLLFSSWLCTFPLCEFGHLPSTEVVNSYWFYTYIHSRGRASNTTFVSSLPRKTKEYLYIKTFLSCAQAQNTCARLNKSPKKKRLIKANEEFLCKLVRFLHRESRECRNFDLPCGFWVPDHNVSI